MLASDVAPSRLQRARLAILDYVQRRWHGRVGIVAFAGQAFLQCPLTFDYSAFQDALLAIDDKTIPVPGTDIGRALDEAYRAMDKPAAKTLVLLTDGKTRTGRRPHRRALARRGSSSSPSASARR
jgi:Ca-activated chloride channel family protein